LSYRRNLFAVTAASFIGFMGFTLVMPFLPLYFRQLGVDDVGRVAMWSGLSLGVTPAMTALLSPLWGRLADRFGRKIMVERSLVSFVVIMGAMAVVTKPWHVFALRVVQGIFAGYGALSVAMAADSAPEGGMSQAIGTVQTAQRLGPALGPVLGGSLAALVGLRRAFLVTAACYAIALVLVFFMYDERITHAHAREEPDGVDSITFRNVLAFENFLLMALVIFGFQFVDRSFGPVLPLFVGALGTPPARVALVAGTLFSIGAGTGAVGHHVCATLLRYRTAAQLVVAASALAAVGCIGYLVAPRMPWLFAATPVFGLAIGFGTTAAYTAAAAVIPPNVRGLGFGLMTTASLVGMATSPILCGLLASASIRAVFALDAGTLVALAFAVRHLGKGESVKTPAPEPVAEAL
jgi:DHA1 family multidrug resistance protein-like MFS transporter